ncbi:hypothetical protein PG997_005381 [Apiospora hydei]|uniref:Uncharacterized protein n=1 Tax=Apiospora hydei TaxID=1337664 RepID=A0ABR1X4R3_9PEZI
MHLPELYPPSTCNHSFRSLAWFATCLARRRRQRRPRDPVRALGDDTSHGEFRLPPPLDPSSSTRRIESARWLPHRDAYLWGTRALACMRLIAKLHSRLPILPGFFLHGEDAEAMV